MNCKSAQGASTKIGFFESDSDLRYQDEIHGSLLDQIDRIIETVHLKYMKAKITYEGMQRIERYFVPDGALRETLLNALCHKDYARGIPIQVSVYDDRLYIANCGRLPESWGRGIEKICESCREDGVPLPEYDITGNSVMIKFIAPEDRIVRTSLDRVTEKVTEVTEPEKEILSLLLEDPAYTYAVLADKLGISRKTVSLRIKQLKEKEVLLLPDGRTIPFADCGQLFASAQLFSEPALPTGAPLTLSEVKERKQIWLEPISPDSELRNELRGWYRVQVRLVQNKYGNRFYLDTYGAKWLAFEKED